MMTQAGEIRQNEECVDYSNYALTLRPCRGQKDNQEWIYATVCMS